MKNNFYFCRFIFFILLVMLIGISFNFVTQYELQYAKLKDDPNMELNTSKLVGTWVIEKYRNKDLDKITIAQNANGSYKYVFFRSSGLQVVDQGSVEVIKSKTGTPQKLDVNLYGCYMSRNATLRFVSEGSSFQNDQELVFYYNKNGITRFSINDYTFMRIYK